MGKVKHKVKLFLFELSRTHDNSVLLQYDHGYSPRPYDLRNMTLTREMQNLAEKLAENSHDLWAKRKKEELEAIGKYIFITMLGIYLMYHFSFVSFEIIFNPFPPTVNLQQTTLQTSM